jgi:hypothetical protein
MGRRGSSLTAMARIEIVPVPNRDIDEDAGELVTELNALGHEVRLKLEAGAHAGVAIAIRILDDADGIAELEEHVRQLLGLMRRRREEREAPREVAAVYGPDGSVLLEVEI